MLRRGAGNASAERGDRRSVRVVTPRPRIPRPRSGDPRRDRRLRDLGAADHLLEAAHRLQRLRADRLADHLGVARDGGRRVRAWAVAGDPRRLRRSRPAGTRSPSPPRCSRRTGRRTSTPSSTTGSSRPRSATSWRRSARWCSGSPCSRNGRRTAQKVALVLATAAVVELTVSYGRPPVAALVMAVTWSVYGLLKRRVPLPAIDSFAAESFVLVVPAADRGRRGGRHVGQHPAQRRRGDLALVALSGVATAVPLILFAFRPRRVPLTRARTAAVPRARRSPSCSAGRCTTRSSRGPASSASVSCGRPC